MKYFCLSFLVLSLFYPRYLIHIIHRLVDKIKY